MTTWLPWLVIGCGRISAPEMLVPPAPTLPEPAPMGERGPWGAALVETRAQARVSDTVPLDIVYPAGDDGQAALQDSPVVVLVHGGLVAPERYHWLAAHLATRGWVTVLPEADLRLAIFESGNGEVALDHLQALSESSGALQGIVAPASPVITMGHSLGGVMAAEQWAGDPEVDGLVLLASFPTNTAPIEEAGDRPVLSLIGTTDVFDFERLEAQLARFEGPVTDARVQGMNHYAWTDNASEADLAGDGDQRRALPATREDALTVLDTWLDVHVFEGDPAQLDGPFSGVELR